MRNLHNIDELRSVLDYCHETGVFKWKVRVSNAMKGGMIAGNINKKGRRMLAYKGVRYMEARLAWAFAYGRWPEDQIDHIDGNKLNNAIANLREATNQQNAANRPALRTNRHGTKGVVVHNRVRKPARYRARIRVNNKLIHLGYFSTPREAEDAYMRAARDHFGDFACGSQRIQFNTEGK